jgi:hypothetical protein
MSKNERKPAMKKPFLSLRWTLLGAFASACAAQTCDLEKEQVGWQENVAYQVLPEAAQQRFLAARDFSPLLTYPPRARYIGYVGENYRRLQWSIARAEKKSSTEYAIHGEIDGQPYAGRLQIQQIKTLPAAKFPLLAKHLKATGLLLAEMRLDSPASSETLASGVFIHGFYLDADDNLLYNDWDSNGDSYKNNLFFGRCILGKGQPETCAWGHYRAPCSGDLDIGAGEFSPDEKYLNNGWREFLKTPVAAFRLQDLPGRYRSNVCGLTLTLSSDRHYVISGSRLKTRRGIYELQYWKTMPVSLQLLHTKGEPLFLSLSEQMLEAFNIENDVPLPPPHFSFCHAATLLFEKITTP